MVMFEEEAREIIQTVEELAVVSGTSVELITKRMEELIEYKTGPPMLKILVWAAILTRLCSRGSSIWDEAVSAGVSKEMVRRITDSAIMVIPPVVKGSHR